LHVDSKVIEDAQDVCAAGLTIAAFFYDMGLPKELSTCVDIADSIPPERGMNALGYFDPETREIHILSFGTASNGGYWLGRSIDRALYRSLAAHEVAHAFTFYNASVKRLSVRAREYVAYVAMFSTMDPNLRQEILADVSGGGFEKEEQISETYYYLAPYHFAVNAYRHYLRPENGAHFFQAVIRGQALLELDD
jgi:hypothetical protein